MTWMKFAWLGLATSLITIIPILPAAAQLGDYRSYVSASGSGTACTFSAPCSNIQNAVNVTNTGGIVSCLDENDYTSAVTISTSLTIDCGGWASTAGPFTVNGSGIKVTIRNLTIFDQGTAIGLTQGAALTLDNVHIVGNFTDAISVTTNTPSTSLVVKNSLFEYNAFGILINPSSGGSVNATLDHVTITNNSGGGIKTNSADGIVNLDITESEISYNGGVGVNGRSGGFLNMVNIKNSVINENGAQGVQANGANVGITVQATLLDQNTGGATSIEAGGHISTYGNNSIIGSSGSGFTGTASLQ
jgi:hypothetical protein